MKRIILMLFIAILFNADAVNAQGFNNYGIVLSPDNSQVWTYGGPPSEIRVYDTGSLALLATHSITELPAGLEFNSAGNFAYLICNDPEANTAFVRRYTVNGTYITQPIEVPLKGIACDVLVHSNGDVYVTSEDAHYGAGWIERFQPDSLVQLAESATQGLPNTSCESSYDGNILVGGSILELAGSAGSIDYYTPVYVHDELTLERLPVINSGQIPIDLFSVNNLLVAENQCLTFDEPESGINIPGKGLIITDLSTGLDIYEWSPLPEFIRGSCYEPVNQEWFGFTFDPYSTSLAQLWTISDLSNPIPLPVESFYDTRIVYMVAFPHGSSQTRLIGISFTTDALFSYDTPTIAPPVLGVEE